MRVTAQWRRGEATESDTRDNGDAVTLCEHKGRAVDGALVAATGLARRGPLWHNPPIHLCDRGTMRTVEPWPLMRCAMAQGR